MAPQITSINSFYCTLYTQYQLHSVFTNGSDEILSKQSVHMEGSTDDYMLYRMHAQSSEREHKRVNKK